jgi:hypothetical protein
MIAKYNNISSVNMAALSGGLIPASKAYLDCKADIQTAVNYYETIRLRLLEFPKSFKENISSIITNINHNNFEVDALERKTQVDCDNIYEILRFQAELLNLEEPFRNISESREQKIHSEEIEKLNLNMQVAGLKVIFYSSDLLESYNHYRTAIVELQFLEIRRYALEIKFYKQATTLFEEKIKKNRDKNVWDFLF